MKKDLKKPKTPTTNLSKIFITAAVAAQMFSLSEGTLANLRSRRQGCKFYKIGRRAYYRLSEFETWATSSPVLTSDCLPTSQTGGACHEG